MRTRTVVGVGILLAAVSVVLASDADDGLPFGKMRERDFDRLVAGAKDHGVAIHAEMEKARKGDKDALARVFGLSATFERMDAVTKVYGNLIFTSFLNLVEARGETFFAEALASQPEAVRQRVRDFVYYAVTRVPKGHRKEVEKEVRRDFHLLFPADYVFGQDDALFG
jgi:hypothetical protein